MKQTKLIRKLVGAGVVSAMAMGFAASAQAAGYNWNGFYAGVQVGSDSGDTNMRWGLTPGGALPNNDGPVDIDGYSAGLTLGYNASFNAFVFGLEGDIEHATLNGNDNDVGGHTNELEAEWMGSLRLRAGYAFDRTLVYVTGGYAWMKADGNVTDQPTINSADSTLKCNFCK